MNYRKWAKGLGWLSIGVGMAELVATRPLARVLQMEERKWMLRRYGVREVTTGIGILSQEKKPSRWLWARVGGDLLDLAALARSAVRSRGKIGPIVAAAAVAGVTAVDITCGKRLSRRGA